MNKSLFFFSLFLLSFFGYSRLEKGVKASHKKAKTVLKNGDYPLAFDHYQALLIKGPNNVLYSYKAATCILDIDIVVKGENKTARH